MSSVSMLLDAERVVVGPSGGVDGLGGAAVRVFVVLLLLGVFRGGDRLSNGSALLFDVDVMLFAPIRVFGETPPLIILLLLSSVNLKAIDGDCGDGGTTN